MRINVYAEELPANPDVRIVEKNGHRGLRVYLEGGGRLHCTPEDDDRQAITFWGLMPTSSLVIRMAEVMAECPRQHEPGIRRVVTVKYCREDGSLATKEEAIAAGVYP